MPRTPNRRDFVKTSALAGAGFWLGSNTSLRAQESRSVNEKIAFACIGVGGKGQSDSADAGRAGEVVAICDIDENHLNRAAANFTKAQKFYDFREMLEKLGDKIDAVTVSTPDHTHAAASVMAMKMGKHCFTQKPLTRTLFEARRMGEIAREKKVATQMGNQGTAISNLRRAAEIVWAGGLGTVTEVHVWTNRPIWPQGLSRPSDTPPVPSHVHWNEFLGPAEERPYHPAYHPFKWRGWWAFGTGALGDMACHTMNMPFMALDLRNPISVEAETSYSTDTDADPQRETFPKWSVIRYEFAANDKRPALTMYWYDGGKKVDPALLEGENLSGSGALIIGSEGKMYAPDDYGANYSLLPRDKFKDYKGPEESIPRSPGHFQEWVRAIQGGEPAMSNFPDYAGPLTETVLLGNLAVWSGKKVMWDAKNLKATNMPELDAIIRPKYREGWTL